MIICGIINLEVLEVSNLGGYFIFFYDFNRYRIDVSFSFMFSIIFSSGLFSFFIYERFILFFDESVIM